MPKEFSVEEASKVRENLISIIDKGVRNLTLDFSQCEFIDSTGLGVLVSIYKKCESVNGTLKLSFIKPQVKRLFKLTRLDQVFHII